MGGIPWPSLNRIPSFRSGNSRHGDRQSHENALVCAIQRWLNVFGLCLKRGLLSSEDSPDQRICFKCAIRFPACNWRISVNNRNDRAAFHFAVPGGCTGTQSVYRSPGAATGARSNPGIRTGVSGARTFSGNRSGTLCLFPVLTRGRNAQRVQRFKFRNAAEKTATPQIENRKSKFGNTVGLTGLEPVTLRLSSAC